MPTTIELPEDAATLRPDDQPVLSIRASVPAAEGERFIAEALRDVRVFMQEQHVSAAGPPFSISRPDGNALDIEAGWPTTTNALTGTSRIHSGSLPRSLAGPRASSLKESSARERRAGP